MEIPGGGGSKAKVPSVGGVWIFFGTTQWNKLDARGGKTSSVEMAPEMAKRLLKTQA